MKHFPLFSILVLALGCSFTDAQAQSTGPAPLPAKPAPPVAASPVTAPTSSSPMFTDELTAYLLPIELQKQIRDLQLEYSEIESANQTMLVKVEQNKEKQRDDTQAIQKLWYDFAVSSAIDLKFWEPDPKMLKFVAKKKAVK